MRTTTQVALSSFDLELDISASTDRGAVRRINEDSFVATFPLFVVADGMGGHERGDQASQTAVAVLAERVPADRIPTAEVVLDAISAANSAVVDLSAGNEREAISGTTLAGMSLVLAEDGVAARWMAFNVGDSRIYTWNGRRLQQLTIDHSAVQEMVDAGLLTEAAAREHPERNIITRAIGARIDVDADVWLLPVASVQAFLICSDGLTKELDDDQIAQMISSHALDAGSSLTDALVEAAKRAGGRDNITAVYVESTTNLAEVFSDSTNQRDTAEAILEDTTPRI